MKKCLITALFFLIPYPGFSNVCDRSTLEIKNGLAVELMVTKVHTSHYNVITMLQGVRRNLVIKPGETFQLNVCSAANSNDAAGGEFTLTTVDPFENSLSFEYEFEPRGAWSWSESYICIPTIPEQQVRPPFSIISIVTPGEPGHIHLTVQSSQ